MLITYPEKPKGILTLANYKHYNANWNYTHTKLTNINKALDERFSDENFSVIVAGSYGRMEASSASDFDFFILSYEDVKKEIKEVIKEILVSESIPTPNPDGVFSETLSINDLIENIGHRDDDLPKLAQRMLLLMESRPIYNEVFFKETVEKILNKYLELVHIYPTKEARFLMNDLIRYFRSIAVNYQYTFWKDTQKWVLRNVKLRHSRILIYAGLLFLILNSSKKREKKCEYIKENIYLTPMEKIISVYIDNEDYGYDRILSAYDMFLGKLNSPDIRQQLQVDYGERYENPYYAELKVSSEAFGAELIRFVFQQQNKWSTKIFENLIF